MTNKEARRAEGIRKMKHTPGPWKSGGVILGPDEQGICQMMDQPSNSDEEIFANADLVSAAPDLLDACKKALDYLQRNDCYRDGEAYPALVRAIAKAEGANT